MPQKYAHKEKERGIRQICNRIQMPMAAGQGGPLTSQDLKKKKKVFTTRRFLLLINFLEERTKPLGSRSNTQRTREGTKQT